MRPERSEPLVDTFGVIIVLATQVTQISLNALGADGASSRLRTGVVALTFSSRNGRDVQRFDLRNLCGRILQINKAYKVVIHKRPSVNLTHRLIATSKANCTIISIAECGWDDRSLARTTQAIFSVRTSRHNRRQEIPRRRRNSHKVGAMVVAKRRVSSSDSILTDATSAVKVSASAVGLLHLGNG